MLRFFFSHRLAWLLPIFSLLAGATSAVFLAAFNAQPRSVPSTAQLPEDRASELLFSEVKQLWKSAAIATPLLLANGRPQLAPLPEVEEVWECEVAVIGGSLGGIAAASHAMKTGAQTCVIELSPWMGGQISSQGVSAVDESVNMIQRQNFAPSWMAFKQLLLQQPVKLPNWTGQSAPKSVASINSCWVGRLCFPPTVGAQAAEQQLKLSAKSSPNSRWSTSTAFKGAEFDSTGKTITAIYGVRRFPRDPNYRPQGRLSVELHSWYSWEADDTFKKAPIRLQAPRGKRMIVIDATDTGELVGWARLPYRLGSEARATMGEVHGADFDNPECTQAFTFPFVMAIRNDGGKSLEALTHTQPFYAREEHHRVYTLNGTPMFTGRSFFNYRRIVSMTPGDPFSHSPSPGDMTLVNWTQGNDWNWMNPPLILTREKLTQTGQYQDWMGGLSVRALRHAENHALMFAQWLLETQRSPNFPLAYLSGSDSPMNTASGLSMVPYIREGRRILGRAAYGQPEFMLRESDLREDMEGRDLRPTTVAVTHYDIDIHGCRYRNWEPTGEAQKASVKEYYIRPIRVPLESLIPQEIDNLLIGGKAIAATHIANAATRIHHGEWSIGAAAGATAGWLLKPEQADLVPAAIVAQGHMPQLQHYLRGQGLKTEW